MNIAIVGGGIAGLSFALGLHKRGIDCDVFEAVNEVKEIGVGITLLPHAMRELAEIGVQSAIEAAGKTWKVCFSLTTVNLFTKRLEGGTPAIHSQKLARTAASCTVFCLMLQSADWAQTKFIPACVALAIRKMTMAFI